MNFRKISRFILAILLLVSLLPMQTAKAENELSDSCEIIRSEDGSYFVITTSRGIAITADNVQAVQARTVPGSRTYTYYDSDGSSKWAATLSASFSYNGSTSSCTSSSCSISIYDSAWYTISSGASRSGNTATVNATMGRKNLGVTTKTASCTITLSCDANGKLS